MQSKTWSLNIWNYNCSSNKSTCSVMNTCEEAKFYLNSCWIKSLDKDVYWIPCESLCQ